MDLSLVETGGGTPIESSSYFNVLSFYSTCFKIPGSDRLIA